MFDQEDHPPRKAVSAFMGYHDEKYPKSGIGLINIESGFPSQTFPSSTLVDPSMTLIA